MFFAGNDLKAFSSIHSLSSWQKLLKDWVFALSRRLSLTMVSAYNLKLVDQKTVDIWI